MDTIQRMRVFLRVAEAGSFTSAAKLLDMSVAALSRSVSDLETPKQKPGSASCPIDCRT
jgi:DNA-binding transcriptional LysR family regulator